MAFWTVSWASSVLDHVAGTLLASAVRSFGTPAMSASLANADLSRSSCLVVASTRDLTASSKRLVSSFGLDGDADLRHGASPSSWLFAWTPPSWSIGPGAQARLWTPARVVGCQGVTDRLRSLFEHAGGKTTIFLQKCIDAHASGRAQGAPVDGYCRLRGVEAAECFRDRMLRRSC